MNHLLKKNIRLLAEKYQHRVQYEKEVIQLTGTFNSIQLEAKNKKAAIIRYISGVGIEKIEIPHDETYDILIELFRKKEADRIARKEGPLITLEIYRQEEGNAVDQWLQKISVEVGTKGITHKKMGGNRLEAEYYKGLLILTDDLKFYRSNAIALENNNSF